MTVGENGLKRWDQSHLKGGTSRIFVPSEKVFELDPNHLDNFCLMSTACTDEVSKYIA